MCGDWCVPTQNMEEMEKSHESFLQGAQVELKKEMAMLQKKIMMDTVSLNKIEALHGAHSVYNTKRLR